MKHHCLTRMALVCMAAIGLLLCSSLCQAAVIRVALDGTTPPYDGASWATAYTSIQSAINAASSGDEVRVKGYTDSTIYDACFSMVAGVSVKGGYTGAVDQVTGEDIRDMENYISTVTPASGITDCVVYVPSTVTSQYTSSTVLEGLKITGGSGRQVSGTHYGGGIYCCGSPTIQYCEISGNTAISGMSGYGGNGGGIYCSGSPIIDHCNISNNEAVLNTSTGGHGGGICAVTGTSPVISNNTITYNTGYRGGGILWHGGTCTGNTITDNTASNAASGGAGGGIYFGTYWPDGTVFSYNTVTDNTAGAYTGGNGGGACIDTGGGAAAEFSHNTVSGNTVVNGSPTTYSCGGGIYTGGTVTIAENTIEENQATGPNSLGGGIHITWCSPAITGNTIDSNTASGGGGIHNWHGTSTITGNLISDNSANGATGAGGGICSSYGDPSITSNRFIGNDAERGGAAYIGYGTTLFASNVLSGNSAINYGGGLMASVSDSTTTFANNTLVSNQAPTGAGIFLWECSPHFANNIVALNSTGSGIAKSTNSNPTFTKNNFYSNSTYNYAWAPPTPPGTDLYPAEDPLFVDAVNGDYHLAVGSPCIDAGDDSVVELSWTDMDGQPRMQRAVDIGADEQIGLVSLAKLTTDNTPVDIRGAMVSAAFPDYFYIEADDRSAGIRVEKTSHGLVAGVRADVAGLLKTLTSGERYIEASSATQNGTGTVKPLAMTNQTLGGSPFGYQAGITDAYGWNNIGLLVRTCGVVKNADVGWFTIYDGSSNPDYSELHLKVSVPAGVNIPSAGTKVMVTGVSSCELDGTNIRRLLRLRDANDLQVVQYGHSVTRDTVGNAWNYVAVSIAPFTPEPPTVLSEDPYTMNLCSWNPGYGGYCWDTIEEPPGASFGNMLLGVGYNYYPASNRTIAYSGFPDGLPVGYEQTDFAISLPGDTQHHSGSGGWHLIGNPFNHDICVNDGLSPGNCIFLTDGEETKDWAHAIDAGWCGTSMNGYDSSTNSSVFVAYDDFEKMKTGNSYYFYTNRDNLALIIPATSSDTTAPSVTVNQAPDQADPTASLPIRFLVTFSEPVHGFVDTDPGDVVVGGTAMRMNTSVQIADTGDHMNYAVEVNGTFTIGTITLSVPANAAYDNAAAPNWNTASVAVDNSVTHAPYTECSYSYDSSGNVTVTNANGTSAVYTYDERYRLRQVKNKNVAGTRMDGATLNYTVDGVSSRTFIWFDEDDQNKKNAYTYDAINRLLSADYYNMTDMTFTYDWVGNRLTAGVTQYSYDAADRLFGPSYFGTGSISGTSSPTRTYTYDPRELLSTVGYN